MSGQKQAQTILITGATGGMGAACARLAAERGYTLLLSDLNQDKLVSLAGECSRMGVSVDCQALDITDSAAVSKFVSERSAAPQFDAVIHTAGLSPHMAEWENIIQVDLVAAIRFVEALKESIKPGGAAVCISSMSAHMVPPNAEVETALDDALADGLLDRLRALPGEPLAHSGMAYAYAKKALIHYVQQYAMDWGKEGKRLLSISPGLIDTDMGKLEAESDPDTYAAMRPLIALGRDGLAKEIATAALFLASADASYITGCDLLVDGGFVASVLKMKRAQNG